jgi:hypothetical protein
VSGLDDLIVRVIDRDAMIRRLEQLAFGDDSEESRTFEAAALIHLCCGHVRPMNLWFEPGDELACHVCGPQVVARLELIVTTTFPHPDALRDLTDVAL